MNEEMQTIIIRNTPNNMGTTFPCSLCDGETDKRNYLFALPDGRIVCNGCAQNPESIPAPAEYNFVTEVVPVPEEALKAQDGMYSEEHWPQWMRERLPIGDDLLQS